MIGMHDSRRLSFSYQNWDNFSENETGSDWQLTLARMMLFAGSLVAGLMLASHVRDKVSTKMRMLYLYTVAQKSRLK